ncbi:MAG: phage integrase N-terminal SAM-like domain-containing protein [Armatimonadetes bacterium]|nr:phage integrase N-terminal SAM-like domain-containing protein [Armatimonadota bacterium]
MQQYELKYLECLDLRGVSKRTKIDYFRRINPLERYFSKDPTFLSIQDIREYFLYLIRVKKLGAATLKSIYFSLRFFIFMLRDLKKKISIFTSQKLSVNFR